MLVPKQFKDVPRPKFKNQNEAEYSKKYSLSVFKLFHNYFLKLINNAGLACCHLLFLNY
uniref:Uncharacterized protein n=1 Tax=Anguilla anguilla TaxID=7936 RepID=A0A0E9Y1G4_ANGAN